MSGVILKDGPAAGRYTVGRAPHFLRAVVSDLAHCDLLDQLNDEPNESERVYVYQSEGDTWCPDTLRRVQGIYMCPPPAASGTYHYRADVDGETLRTTAAWKAWCRAEPSDLPLLDGETLELRKVEP